MKNKTGWRTAGLLALAVTATSPGAGDFEIDFTPDGPVRRALPSGPGTFLVVNSPVADLRRTPSPVDPAGARRRPYGIDDAQETQLLHGERVIGYEEKNGWVRVEAVDQPEFTHEGRWQGYPGWVRKDNLVVPPKDLMLNAVVIRPYAALRYSMKWRSPYVRLPLGSRLFVVFRDRKWARISSPTGSLAYARVEDILLDRELPRGGNEIRALILETARRYLGQPYYWGGRAAHRSWDRERPSGIDCSGLVNLSYLAAGFTVPRDSHEQFLAARRIPDAGSLLPGDVVFLAKKNAPNKIIHVLLFEKDETLLEAVNEFHTVRRVTFQKKLGGRRESFQEGSTAGDVIVHFGRLLP